VPVARYTHVGICVTDLDRSLHFYREALGFEELGRLDMQGKPLDQLNQLEGVKVRTAFLGRDGSRLELIEFQSPGSVGPRAARPMNQLGLTHLAFRVTDLDAVCAKIEAAGGSLIRETRMEHPGPTRVIMALDPDGLRVELVERPGPLDAVPGGDGYAMKR
jgi:glyoxylase I family protein